jgi:TetR/AcrR family transcriptional repressor of nem operon
MPYPPEHKHGIRQKILDSARRQFNRRGFSEVTLEDVMAGAGLSHGGFYRHFGSKEELYAEAVRYFLYKQPPEPWQCPSGDPAAAAKTRAQHTIEAYFSPDHFADEEGCCPLIGLPSDVARSGNTVKAAYREVVEMLIVVFETGLNEPDGRERALAAAALCVGGMVLARGVDDPQLADDLRSAARKYALKTVASHAAAQPGTDADCPISRGVEPDGRL